MASRPDTVVDLGGGVTVRAFITATWRTDASPLFGPVPRILWSGPVGDESDDDELIPMASIALLVETPDARVLVDPGPGSRPRAAVPAMVDFDATGLGVLLEVVAGLRLDAIVVTSLRAERVGALLEPGSPLRAAADRVVARRIEWEAALRANERIAVMVDQVGVRALRDSGVGDDQVDGVELLPGIETIATGGFTTGHQAVVVRGRGTTGADAGTFAWFGDLLPRRWHANPRWITALDDLPLESVAAKSELFAQAAADGWLTIPVHEPGAPVGRLVPDRDRFRFEPAPQG